MRVPAATVLLIASLTMLSCGENKDSSFNHELQSIQNAMPSEAHMVSSIDAKRSGNSMEASWQYEITGRPENAKDVFRRAVVKDYQLVHEDDLGLSYARFDGSDSFYLTFVFRAEGRNSTLANVVLKSMPG